MERKDTGREEGEEEEKEAMGDGSKFRGNHGPFSCRCRCSAVQCGVVWVGGWVLVDARKRKRKRGRDTEVDGGWWQTERQRERERARRARGKEV